MSAGMGFRKSIGGNLERIVLVVSDDGLKQHDYGHGCDLLIRSGWNEGCEMKSNNLSMDELRDLRHIIDCALSMAAPC